MRGHTMMALQRAAVLGTLAVGMALSTTASAQTVITASTKLNSDIACTASPCVDIQASNITVNGANHTIDCLGQELGVRIMGQSGVTLKNLEIKNCGTSGAVSVFNGTGNHLLSTLTVHDNPVGINVSDPGTTLTRLKVTNNTSSGLSLGATDIVVSASTFSGNLTGISVLAGADSITVSGCTLKGNTGSAIVSFSNSGIYDSNRISNNSSSGISILATGNSITNNTISSNSKGIEVGGTSNTITGNTSTKNTQVDMQDANADCDSNDWSHNRFGTADPASCIH